MNEYKCTQEVHLKMINKAIFGNGQLGLLKDVEKLKETVMHMNEHLESLSISYAALVKSQLETDAINVVKDKMHEKWGAVITRSAAIIGAAGVVITAIVTFG